MIWVSSLPRTGSSLVMRIFMELGLRITGPNNFDESWMGGHEDPRFNRLGVDLARWHFLPFLGDLQKIPSDGWLIDLWQRIGEGEIRATLDYCFSNFDVIKDVTGGPLLPLALELGYPVNQVIFTLRNIETIFSKYGQVPVHLPARMRTPAHGYGVWGFNLMVCELYDVPYRIMLYPNFRENAEYAWEKLGELAGASQDAFRIAWQQAIKERPNVAT